MLFLAKSWLYYTERNLSRISAWALFSIFDLKTDLSTVMPNDSNILSMIKDKTINPMHEYDKFLGMYIGTKLGLKFDKKEITSLFKEIKNRFSQNKKLIEMAKSLNVEISKKNE